MRVLIRNWYELGEKGEGHSGYKEKNTLRDYDRKLYGDGVIYDFDTVKQFENFYNTAIKELNDTGENWTYCDIYIKPSSDIGGFLFNITPVYID